MPVYAFTELLSPDDSGACSECYGSGKSHEGVAVWDRDRWDEGEEITCPVCKGTGYEPTGGTWQKTEPTPEDEHLLRNLSYTLMQFQKIIRRRDIQRRRLLSLMKAYSEKPVPSVWDWLRRPAV